MTSNSGFEGIAVMYGLFQCTISSGHPATRLLLTGGYVLCYLNQSMVLKTIATTITAQSAFSYAV